MPPTKEQVWAGVDARLTPFLSQIQLEQAEYFAAHSKYAQGLPLATQIPADGAMVPVDNATMHPHDQPETWRDLSDVPDSVGSKVWVDAVHAKEGPGYVVCVAVRVGGKDYVRRIGYGSGTAMTHAWREE